MAKRISKQDATGDFPSALDELKAKFGSLDTAIHASDELVKMFKTDLGKLRKEIAGIDMGSVKGIKEFNAKQKEAQKIMLDTAKLEQQNIKLLQEKEKLKQAEIRTEKLLNTEKKKTLTSYQLESKALNEMRDRYKHLAVQKLNGIKLTKDEEKEYRRLIPQIRQTDAALKKIDATGGQFQRNVGNYPKVMNGFKNALGTLGVAFGAGAFISNAKDVVVQFDNAIADLSAITGATGKDLDFFKKQAISLGVEVKGGASAVVEAYKLIASAKPELLENAAALNSVAESAILLSKASGMELPDAATALTDAMNQFGADADQAAKFVDVLAAGAKFGAAEIPQITEALLRFGAVAKTSNVNIQESTALIEDLAEKGLKGADAGTALRNVMLKLSAPDALPKDAQIRLKQLGVNFDELKDKSKPFSERLDLLKPLLHDNAALVKVFGMENAVAATTLISTTDRIKELTASVDENGVAQEQANVRSKTLSEAYNRFKETINGLILEFVDGKNASSGLADALDFLRKNIGTVLNIAKEGMKVFVFYKTAMMALKLRDQFNDWRKMGTGIKDVGNNLNDAGKSAKSFGNAISSIGFAVIIEMLYEVASAWISVSNGAQLAAERTKLFNDAVAIGNEVATGWLDKRIKAEKKLLQAIDTRVSKGEITEKEAIKLRQNVINQTEEIVKKERLRLTGIKAMTSIQLGLAKAERDRLKKGMNTGFLGNTISEVKAYKEAEDAVSRLIATEKNRSEEIRVLNVFLEGVTDTQHDLNIETNKLNISTGKQTKAVKEKTKAYKDANDQIERMISLQKETQDLTDEIALFEAEADIQAAIESQLESIALSGEYSLDIINARIQAEYDLRKAIIERQYQEIKTQSEADYASGADQGDSGAISRALEKEKNARLKRDFELGKLDKEFINKKKEVYKQLEDAQLSHGEITTAEAERLAKIEADKLKERYENQKKWIELTTKFFEDQIDKRIALLDKESEAHKQQYDYFQGLAESGNINAQQSLAEEARLQREAEKEKAKLEQRKLYLQAFSAFMTNYTNRLENGENSTQALAGAVADKAVLEAILATLPAFYEGTESTGKASNPLDANGGRLSILHDDERVLPKVLNDQVAGISNADLVKYAQMGRIAESVESGNSSWGNIGLMTELNGLRKDFKELTKIVKDKPETDYQYDKAIDGLLTVIKTTKRGNLTTRNETQFRPR